MKQKPQPEGWQLDNWKMIDRLNNQICLYSFYDHLERHLSARDEDPLFKTYMWHYQVTVVSCLFLIKLFCFSENTLTPKSDGFLRDTSFEIE